MLADVRTMSTSASPQAVFAAVSGVGGARGWYFANWLWAARGWIDKLLGGVGMRRGRRHPDELRIGDALDFFRVEVCGPAAAAAPAGRDEAARPSLARMAGPGR